MTASADVTEARASPPFRLLILGATGAVGCEVLRLSLADPRFDDIVAPTRRALPPHPKLVNPVTDLTSIDANDDAWNVDAIICALGTTIKVAGSQQAFASIDRDLPIAIARAAKSKGAKRFALNSSLGASLKGNFYLRTKAEAEEGIRALGFASYTIVRPSLIDAERDVPRLGERVGLAVARVLGPLIPRRYRPVKAHAIAHALVEAVCRPSGVAIVESEELQS